MFEVPDSVVIVTFSDVTLFLVQIAPQTRDLASKISKKIPGVTPRTPLTGVGDPLPQPPQHGYTPCAGAQAPPLLEPRSRKPFPLIKIYHYTPA